MLEQLYPLALLACSLVMGVMMWMMMRGHKQQAPMETADYDNQLARLRAEVDQLKAAQHHGTQPK